MKGTVKRFHGAKDMVSSSAPRERTFSYTSPRVTEDDATIVNDQKLPSACQRTVKLTSDTLVVS
jgi:hypothetical protein